MGESRLGSTVATLLTPEGRGAIASILVSGPEAVAICDRLFRAYGARRLVGVEAGRLLVGRIGAEVADEVVVHAVPGVPEPQVQIDCHGGPMVVKTLLGALESQGARVRRWQEVLSRTGASRVQAEALEALAGAMTMRVAGHLLAQYRGALEKEVEQVLGLLDERADADQGGADRFKAAHERLGALLGLAEFGLHLVRPWKVVIAGRPNVGKSSLINALVGYERAIVAPVPGTTRDVVTAWAALDGWPVELADTAGMRKDGDALEREGMRRAEAAAEEADLQIVVFDVSERLTDEDRRLAKRWASAVRVANKVDLARAWEPAEIVAHVVVSAKTGEGIENLVHVVAERLVGRAPGMEEAVAFTERQASGLQRAQERLSAGDYQEAREALRAIL